MNRIIQVLVLVVVNEATHQVYYLRFVSPVFLHRAAWCLEYRGTFTGFQLSISSPGDQPLSRVLVTAGGSICLSPALLTAQSSISSDEHSYLFLYFNFAIRIKLMKMFWLTPFRFLVKGETVEYLGIPKNGNFERGIMLMAGKEENFSKMFPMFWNIRVTWIFCKI